MLSWKFSKWNERGLKNCKKMERMYMKVKKEEKEKISINGHERKQSYKK